MKFKLLFIIGAFATILISCKKNAPDKWLKNNITVIGYNPVITSFSTVPKGTTTVSAGSTITLDLRYWSEDVIDKVILRDSTGTNPMQTVSTTPYQKAYSTVSKTDSLILQYQVPPGIKSGTTIIMQTQVVNKNTLTAKSTINLKVQ